MEFSKPLRPAQIGLRLFVLIIGILVLGFFALVAWYWSQIRLGNPVTLASTGQFTSSGKSVASSARPERQALEGGLNPSLGSTVAPITIVEFIDFRCPNSRTAAPIMQRVVARYGSKVRLIVRDLPIESIYPGSTYLSAVGHCAFLQNRYWPAQDYLFSHQEEFTGTITDDQLRALADTAGLELSRLKTCLANPAIGKAVDDDYFLGVGAGVRGTPTFFVNGQKVEGTVSFESWERYIKTIK